MRCLGTTQYNLTECTGFQMLFLWKKKKKNHTFHSPCRYAVVASSSSCAQVSSTGAEFNYWLTVSITIIGMIGSFKFSEESCVLYLLLLLLLGFFQQLLLSGMWKCVVLDFSSFMVIAFLDLWLKSPCSILSDLYIWMKIYAWELNVPVLSNQTGLLSGSWDCIKV